MNDANEVGSHMAPNFMIHLAFSFDGNGPRDREIVAREHINDEWRPVYFRLLRFSAFCRWNHSAKNTDDCHTHGDLPSSFQQPTKYLYL